MKKNTILFALLFMAFSAKAQIVYETHPQDPSKKILSFNGPAYFDGPPSFPHSNYSLSGNYKNYTTWHGKGHLWTYNLCYFQMSLNGMSFGFGSENPNPAFNSIMFGTWKNDHITLDEIVTADIRCYGNLFNVSDMAAKTNIAPVSGALNTISALKPVTYKWSDPSMNIATRATANPKEIGFIAQDLEQVIPDIVAIDKDNQKLVNYQALIPILTAAIQELTARIEVLENQIKAQ